jgi:hypothetical protein
MPTINSYRKKPVVILAIQFDGENYDEIIEFAGKDNLLLPQFEGTYLGIKTLEGDHTANVGDYIIKGVKGEFYPCKPDIFHMTYDLVSSE